VTDWLAIAEGHAPLIVSVPHAGIDIPGEISGLRSLAVARHDADHHVGKLYAFAREMGATLIETAISRSVIDVNRDPSGASLYPGQVTTGLCPVETFASEPLYSDGQEPDGEAITRRRTQYFDPYHAALTAQIARLRAAHPAVVLYDAHSIRSHVPRLFEGELPQFNIGSFGGASCASALSDAVANQCAGHSHIINGRFKGGWITRHYGNPAGGVHAIQMELAMRGYLDEAGDWPPIWDAARANALQPILRQILTACLSFAKDQT
jgi:N-formylglutamate deformylase